MTPIELSIILDDGGLSQVVAAGAGSLQTTPILAQWVTLTATVDIFARQGVNPIAVATGADQMIPAGIYRVSVRIGNRIAVIAVGTAGSVYFTPGA